MVQGFDKKSLFRHDFAAQISKYIDQSPLYAALEETALYSEEILVQFPKIC